MTKKNVIIVTILGVIAWICTSVYFITTKGWTEEQVDWVGNKYLTTNSTTIAGLIISPVLIFAVCLSILLVIELLTNKKAEQKAAKESNLEALSASIGTQNVPNTKKR